jgi:DNA-binding beta-propeller fold protein YncE
VTRFEPYRHYGTEAQLRQSLILHGLVCATLFVSSTNFVHAQGATPRAFVLDQDAKSLTTVDVASGAVLQTATLQGSPGTLLRTADGKSLLVLDRGAGKDAGDAGFQAKSKSALTILDANTLAVRSRVELGWGLEPTAMLTGTSDRLSVICPGYVGKKPDETLPREIVTVDLTSGQVVGRIALPRPASAFFGTPDGRMAVILSARDKPKQTPPLPAELQFVDLAAGKSLATLKLEGDPKNPVLSPDGKFVYLLDRGNPSGNPDKNVNGRLFIFSTEGHKLETTTDVGSKPRGFVLDEGGQQLLLLSDSPPVKGVDREGELRIIRGANVQAPIKVPAMPEVIRAAADGKRIFVVSGDAISGFALPDFAPLTSTRRPSVINMESAISPDGRRAFVAFQQNLWTYDLESGKELEKVTTGRMSQRLLLATEAAVQTAASKSSGRREAEAKGKSQYFYTEYSLRDASETIAVAPDSKAAYVLNQQTGDVTIVDSSTGTTVDKIGAGGFAVHFLPGASTALVIDNSAVHAIDMTTNKKLDDLASGKFGAGDGFSRIEVSPDGKYAVVYGPQAVACVNGSSGKASGHVRPFTRVVDVEFDWGARR